MRRFALPVVFATLTLLGSTGLATAVPAPPIELRAVVACSEGLQLLPPPDKECLAMDVLVGDLDIAGAGRQYPRDDTGDVQITLLGSGTARFTSYERDHAGGRFAILIGGRVIATFAVGDPAYRRPTIIPGLRPLTPPGFITMPNLSPEEANGLTEQFKAETALEWCARHAASTDDYAQKSCSGYKSQADLTEPAPVIDADSLRAAKPLEGDRLRVGRLLPGNVPKLDCALPKRYGPGAERLSADQQKELMQVHCGFFGDGPDGLLAPPDARNVKLALRAAFRPSFGLPATEIHIAVSSATEGTYLLAQRDKNTWETRSGALTAADIDKILLALEESHFWQLPFDHKMGVLDGMPILVEAAFGSWRRTSTQNAYEGVDLDTLAKELSAIARAHNTERPLSWFK
jgi:hypothetical protein